jgi:Zn-dependent peptidase ImmA (M78 family)/DNA-binding XRE family transcriptional regulator
MAGFNPTRLQIARERRGLFSKELAAQLGVSDKTISNWECGNRQPSESDVAKLAQVTGFPDAFFEMGEVDPLLEGAVSFRARSRIPARQKHSALAAGVMVKELAKWIEQRFELPAVRLHAGLPDLAGQPPDLVARVVRSNWLLGDKPIPNMIHLLESRGVLVLSLAQDVQELDAFSFWSGSRPVILLNTMKTVERSRMDAAHELMHLLCHKERTDKEEEEQANQFAGALLMPESDVRAHVPQVLSGLGRLVIAKRRWGVALSALTYRLHELGIASDWQYRSLFVQLSRRGKDKEPNPMPKRETSRVMSQVFDALEKRGIKRADVAEELGWHRHQLDEFIFGLGATLLPVQGGRRSAGTQQTDRKRDHLQLVGSDKRTSSR